MDPVLTVGTLGAAALGTAGAAYAFRRKGLHRWLPGHLLDRDRSPVPGRPLHVLLAVCDHFEPDRDRVPADRAARRVGRWLDEYPKRFARFRDADGRPPQHSFFYPIDEYRAEYVDVVAGLCRRGFGEVEIHLHHDRDTADNLRRTLVRFRDLFADRHGLLATDRTTGATGYAFIHGNWALDNARSDGRWCGVANELTVLKETGCYADFTLPSAPSETQTRTVNRIYWAAGRAGRCKSHDRGTPVGEGPAPADGLLMIQGPLALDWSRPKFGLLPRIENANLQRSQPPHPDRLARWLRCGVRTAGRPDWTFVKLHTHGAEEANADVLLGEPMERLHAHLAERAAADPHFHFHYVTAREMANLALASLAPEPVSVAAGRDWRYLRRTPPEAARDPS